LSLVFLLIKPVQATTSTVRGSAWWADQSSYLYFDCLDDIMGDRFDVPYNLCGGVFFPPNPFVCGDNDFAFHFYSVPCSSLVHHVSIANNGNLTGAAWNYSKGLITFNGTSTPDSYAFNTNCPNYPSISCTSANNCTACYNENNQNVYGWARAINDDTWIDLNPATTSPTQIKSWDLTSPLTFYNSYVNPGDFVGYATTASSSLSFNCVNTSGGSNCTSYKVYISNLQAGHLTAPNWSSVNACNSGALDAVLTWDLKSGGNVYNSLWPSINYQTSFEIILNTINSTSSPVFDSGVVAGSANQYIINTSNFPAFNYNSNYYWWVKLQDENSNWTQWYQFGAINEHQGVNDIISNSMGNTYTSPDAKTFKTYKHEFPTALFSWSPNEVLVGSSTEFTSNSQYYTSGSPTTPQNCSGSNCLYLWTLTDQEALISSTTTATTSITFFSATSTTVDLQLTDADNYSCSTSTTMVVNYGLPIWREVKAR